MSVICCKEHIFVSLEHNREMKWIKTLDTTLNIVHTYLKDQKQWKSLSRLVIFEFTEINKCALFLQFSQEVSIKQCISCSIFDTVDDYSSTGCGLETDRVWLSLRVCLRTCVFLVLSDCLKKHAHTQFSLPPLRGKRRISCIILSSSSSCCCYPFSISIPLLNARHMNDWRMGTHLHSCPLKWVVVFVGVFFQFSYPATDVTVSADVKRVVPSCACVWGHRRVFKNTQTHCCCGMKGQIKACPLFIMA